MSEMIKTSAQDMTQLAQVAEMLVKSAFCGVKNPADALWIVATGHSLGIDPVTSLRGIHVISGKPVLSADLMAAVAMRHPACEYLRVAEMTPERCVVHVKRHGWPEHTAVTFGLEDAKAAQLMKNPTWQKYPADMCKARAIARAARLAFPDALLGVYVDGELDDVPAPPPAPEAINVTPKLYDLPLLPAMEGSDDEKRAAGRTALAGLLKAARMDLKSGAGLFARYYGTFEIDEPPEVKAMSLAELHEGLEHCKSIWRKGGPDALRKHFADLEV